MLDHPAQAAAQAAPLRSAAPRPTCPRCGLELAPGEGGELNGAAFAGASRSAAAAVRAARWTCPEPYCDFAEPELEHASETGARRARAALEETHYAHEGSAWLQALRRAS